MKQRTLKNIYYILAGFYVFIGALLLDWSFNMVPPTVTDSVNKINVTLVCNVAFVVIGLCLFVSNYLYVRGRLWGGRLLSIIFFACLGWLTIIFLATIFAVFVRGYSSSYLGTLVFYAVLLSPVVALHAARQKMKESK